MKKLVLTLAILGALAFQSGPARAQSCFLSQGLGPYYATPSWDQKIPGAQRFICLVDWNNEAVLDRETGLVWQRTPGSEDRSLGEAVFDCYNARTGDRKGWRLPTPEELTTLVDPTQSRPALPPGHPFQLSNPNALLLRYFTVSTTFPQNIPQTASGPFAGIVVDLADGNVSNDIPTFARNGKAWCVRGGSHVLTDFQGP